MSLAACKEEENSRIAEILCEVKEKMRLFESYMGQGLASDEQIDAARDADAALKPSLEEWCRRLGKLNRQIAGDDG